jgi:hypothetical protein
MVSNGGPVCQSAAVAPGRGFGAPLRDLPGRLDYGVNSDRTARGRRRWDEELACLRMMGLLACKAREPAGRVCLLRWLINRRRVGLHAAPRPGVLLERV